MDTLRTHELSARSLESHPAPPAHPDGVHGLVDRLARSLPPREDNRVLLELLEDELREGLGALGAVEGHFADILEALHAPRLSPLALLEAGDDTRAREQLEKLVESVESLRRRLSKVAGRMHATALHSAVVAHGR